MCKYWVTYCGPTRITYKKNSDNVYVLGYYIYWGLVKNELYSIPRYHVNPNNDNRAVNKMKLGKKEENRNETGTKKMGPKDTKYRQRTRRYIWRCWRTT